MDLLVDSIAQFAVTGSAVRCMLRDQHDYELATALRLSDQQRDQRDALLSKLARTQDALQVSRFFAFVLSFFNSVIFCFAEHIVLSIAPS